MATYVCGDEERLALVKKGGVLNGIDFLEVFDFKQPAHPEWEPLRQLLLGVRLLKPAALTAANIRIEGGVRLAVRVLWALPFSQVPPGVEKDFVTAYFAPEPPDGALLIVRTDSAGDFSTYRLDLVASPTDPGPPAGFDPRLAAVDFSFKVECPSDFDCKPAVVCPPALADEPEINYLAKDYASFRRLMLDRMSAIAPAWTERSPADVGVMLVELLAYVGDSLSYYQDAVASEAYLGTARKRISVRRHARLVDYPLHEGASARAWVHFQAAGDAQKPLPAGTRVLTRWSAGGALVSPDDLPRAVDAGAVVFETLTAFPLRSAHNEIAFYTWSDKECCLPAGATAATLVGPLPELRPKDPKDAKERRDLLLFEEVVGPATGDPADADPRHRHVVRLTAAVDGTDPLTGQAIVEIAWDAADALPFPLCISAVTDAKHGATAVARVSVARGNLALADHGFTVAAEDLGAVPAEEAGPFRPLLQQAPLTHAVPLPPGFDTQPAAVVRSVQPQNAGPAIVLDDGTDLWVPQRDLLASGRFDRAFVAEVEEDGHARLRFGDEENGRRPAAGLAFTATYRVGSGTAGNVGADALSQGVFDPGLGITAVRNPLPAWGGAGPQALEEVRQYAPQAFRVQQRAVTEADYAAVAERHPEVQRAAATFRWTGSWYTVFVTVDRLGGGAVDAAFKERLRAHLEPFRMAGYDLEVDGPQTVALDVGLQVCAGADYFRGQVLSALLARLGTRVLPDGRRGFFHPDDWTFGQPVYLSRLYAAAAEVEGVESVTVQTFQRLGQPPGSEIADGVLPIDRLEIARLDNDPNFPENGRLVIAMGGGK